MGDKWNEAMKVEIKNFYKFKVWENFPRNMLKGCKMLSSQCLFKKILNKTYQFAIKDKLL